MAWSVANLDGRRGFKLIPGRFPPVRHFEHIAHERDWDSLDSILAMTDDQARDEIGQIELVPANERFGGRHAAQVMAAFTSFNPAGSRFSDGSYGVFYLQLNQEDAISEARSEASAFLTATKERPIKLRLGLYSVGLAGNAADLRNVETIRRESAESDTWNESRALGVRLRAEGMAGVLYPAADAQGKDSLALFKASALTDCVRDALVELNWDGRAIDSVTVLPDSSESAGA